MDTPRTPPGLSLETCTTQARQARATGAVLNIWLILEKPFVTPSDRHRRNAIWASKVCLFHLFGISFWSLRPLRTTHIWVLS